MIEKFYENLLGLKDGWSVGSVEQNNNKQEVTVNVSYDVPGSYKYPKCWKEAAYHDTRERTIRHLDTCDYKTWIKVRYPRVKCPLCGTVAVAPPFAATSSHFSKAFEWRIVQLCHSSSVQKVAKDLCIEWHVIKGIKERAVKRGMARQYQRHPRKVKNIAVDETSFRKYHDYVTVITEADQGYILAVLPGREAETLTNWFATQRVADFSELKSISMDMAPPYIKAIKDTFKNADELICFDRFHITQLFNRAVDEVRRKESAGFKKGENPLVKTRFDWLRNDHKTDNRTSRRRDFHKLVKQPLDTVKAWKLKESASTLWDYKKFGVAEKEWKKLVRRLLHSHIGELKKLGKTVHRHILGILNAIKLRANNGLAEARNSCIQRVKCMACGYRNRERFITEIIFQWGGLNMAF